MMLMCLGDRTNLVPAGWPLQVGQVLVIITRLGPNVALAHKLGHMSKENIINQNRKLF